MKREAQGSARIALKYSQNREHHALGACSGAADSADTCGTSLLGSETESRRMMVPPECKPLHHCAIITGEVFVGASVDAFWARSRPA